VNPGTRTSSYWSTGSRAYLSRDGHTAFAEIYPPGTPGFNSNVHIKQVRAKLKAAAPSGVQTYVTGRDALQEASSGNSGPSVFTEALIGGAGALVILFFVFGTLPAVLIPIAIAIPSIGIGRRRLPAVSVITAITLLPALLATLGTRVNSIRLLPRRLVDRGHPEDGPWGRWANLVSRRPVWVAAVGLVIVGLLVFEGFRLNP